MTLFQITANIIGFATLGGMAFCGLKAMRYGKYVVDRDYELESTWNTWKARKRLKQLAKETQDEKIKAAIKKYFFYSGMSLWVMLSGFLLFVVNAMLNVWQNGTGN
jgi:hypothetical protein